MEWGRDATVSRFVEFLSRGILLGILLVGAGCDTSDPVPPRATPSPCAEPQQGQRFAVCGQLTTSVGAAQGTAWVIEGSADARPQEAEGARYQTKEGTFHAGN